MPFFLDHSGLVVFNDSLERHPRSSFEDGLHLHPLTGLSKALEVFWARLVQVCEIHTNSPLPTLLLYYYSIGQPLRVEDLFDSPCFFELHNFILNNVGMFF